MWPNKVFCAQVWETFFGHTCHSLYAWPPPLTLDIKASPLAIKSPRDSLAAINVDIDDNNNNIDTNTILFWLSDPSQQAYHLTPQQTSASASASASVSSHLHHKWWRLSAEC